jgi:C_GCAxxG_C_C family probable redox protein
MTENVAQKSKELFQSGYYCAESVLLAIAEEKGIESDLIPKIATGFCSGMARTGGVCGAVSGAMLALNLVTGRSTPEESIEENYVSIRELLNSFEEKFGSTNCMELVECDLGTEEGQKFYEENNRFVQCLEYVGEATGMALEKIGK